LAKLEDLRDKINEIDDRILNLVNRRAKIALKVGEEKSRKGTTDHFHIPHREREIIDRLKDLNKGPFSDSMVEVLFREIFSASLALERTLRIAYLGPESTFTHQAAICQFGHSAQFIPQPGIDTVFLEVERENSDYGVVPIENSIEGMVNSTMDQLTNSSLVICDELKMDISLFLLSKLKDTSKIKTVYSHPQPLGQSRNWLNQNLPNAEQVVTSSTAAAAAMAAKDKTSAAIASQVAGELYKLNALAKDIEDRPDNRTRFLIVSKRPAKKAKKNKTSIIFSINDETGALLKILKLFADRKINLSNIQSRPAPQRRWEYLFFIDFDGHIEEDATAEMVEILKSQCLFFKFLGSYPSKSQDSK